MIVHLFNSSVVSGPEILVLGNLLHKKNERIHIIFLSEVRLGTKPKAPIDYAQSLGFKTSEIKVKSRFDKTAIQSLSFELQSLNPKIVHAHDVKASLYLALSKRLSTCQNHTRAFKTLSTHHGVRGRPGLINKIYERIYCHWVLPKLDRTLCVCDSDREILIKRGLAPDKIITHANGVTRSAVFQDSRNIISNDIRKNWKLFNSNINPHIFTIGIVGRYSKEKRHELLLKVLKRVKDIRPDLSWQLLCFGSGQLEKPLRKMTESLGLSQQVHWMGYRTTIGQETAGFDLLVSLSFAEGLPINLIEAGWAGTPVFATWVDGNKDLFPSEDYGVVFSPKANVKEISQRMVEIIEQKDKRDVIGKNFQKRVIENFSGEVWLDHLFKIYQDLV